MKKRLIVLIPGGARSSRHRQLLVQHQAMLRAGEGRHGPVRRRLAGQHEDHHDLGELGRVSFGPFLTRGQRRPLEFILSL